MILQYRGKNNNWCYIEAETITYANVEVYDVTEKFRNDMCCQEKWTSDDFAKMELDSIACKEKVEARIIKETGCIDNIYIMGDKDIRTLDNVCVVMLDGDNFHKCYAFPFGYGAYLLNSNGKTIQKLV